MQEIFILFVVLIHSESVVTCNMRKKDGLTLIGVVKLNPVTNKTSCRTVRCDGKWKPLTHILLGITFPLVNGTRLPPRQHIDWTDLWTACMWTHFLYVAVA